MRVQATNNFPELAVADPEWWVSHSSGRAIKIVDMPDEHLAFAIQMIERGYDIKGNTVPEYCSRKLTGLRQEADRRRMQVKEEGWDA